MADYDCDYCSAYGGLCPYAYSAWFCYVEKIKEARMIVDDKFIELLDSLEMKNASGDNDTLTNLTRTLRNLVNIAWMDLPEWAEEELKNETLESV